MLSIVAVASVGLLAGVVQAEPLATITPCASGRVSGSVAPITVTSQYQTVSTCVPTTACVKGGLCQTDYSYETFQYVSTVIPCAFGTTTVTEIHQFVTVSEYITTATSFLPQHDRKHARPTPVYSTISQGYVVPYNQIGPLAIEGYEGSGLCKNCGKDDQGARRQPLTVTECTAGPQGTNCVEYTKTLVSYSAPAATWTSAAVCSTSFVAPSAGSYTFAFPRSAPATTIASAGQIWGLALQSYTVYVTQWFDHPGPLQFATTVTQTITQTVPASTQPASTTKDIPVPPNWPPPYSSASFPLSSTSMSIIGPSTTSATTTHSSSSTSSSTSYSYSSTTSSSETTTITSGSTTASIMMAPAFSNVPTDVAAFYITAANMNAHYRKRAIDFVSFGSGGDGVLVGDTSSASQFKLYEGYIFDINNGHGVGTDATSGTRPLELFAEIASAGGYWSLNRNSLIYSEASFCFTSDNEVFMVFPGSEKPAGCMHISLGIEHGMFLCIESSSS